MSKWIIGILIMVFALCVAAYSAFALTLEWDRNSEPDMKEYHVKGCDVAGCTLDPTVTLGIVSQTAVGVLPTFALPVGKEGKRAVTAVDNSGNESVLSVSIPFDALAPGIPANLHVR